MSYQFGHIDPEERLGYAEEPPPSEDPPPRRHLPAVLLVVGVIGAFAGGLWFAYHQGTKHAAVATASSSPAAAAGAGASAADNVPLIRAGTDPVKVKPEKAGGMNIPEKDDPLYAMRPGAAPLAEHILPPPEAPQPRPVAPPPPPPPAAVTQASAPATAFPPPLPAPPEVAALPKPAAKPAEAAKPAAVGPPTKIQLASLRSPDEAREEWQRLKRDNSDLLGKLTAVVVRADLGERGIWYRVEIGPVGDRTTATKLCKALKERDLGCQLVQ